MKEVKKGSPLDFVFGVCECWLHGIKFNYDVVRVEGGLKLIIDLK